jgi:hypothetical protein
VAIAINTGFEQQASLLSSLIAGNNGLPHQVRGIVSRAAFSDLLARRYDFPCFGSFDVIFSRDDAEQQIERVPPPPPPGKKRLQPDSPAIEEETAKRQSFTMD